MQIDNNESRYYRKKFKIETEYFEDILAKYLLLSN
jgi:hypothetical protein